VSWVELFPLMALLGVIPLITIGSSLLGKAGKISVPGTAGISLPLESDRPLGISPHDQRP